jgi:putative ABC transport system substrate-binding protein
MRNGPRAIFFVPLVLGILAAPPAAHPQQPGKVPRIGFLGITSEAGLGDRLAAFRQGLRDLGYVEGKNLVIEFRWAEGKYDRLPDLAAELIGLKVDVLVTHSTPGVRAAKRATRTVPIVMAVTGDAVTLGLVASIARPGGGTSPGRPSSIQRSPRSGSNCSRRPFRASGASPSS